MVASGCILSEGFDGSYYTQTGAVGYYAPSANCGVWFGAGAKALGLEGAVDPLIFARLLANRHPTLERPFIKKRTKKSTAIQVEDSAASQTEQSPLSNKSTKKERAGHRPGFDITFSAPKSVSALMAVADEEVCRQIEAAFDRAVTTTLRWAEANVPLTRSGKNGVTHELAKLVIATFDHHTNRNGDPDLHRHAVFINACQTEQGRWLTLNSSILLRWIRTLGPIFRCALGAELTRTLGVELARHVDERGKLESWFEVVGVPKPLRDHWSSRRNEIEAELAEIGELSGSANARAKSRANLKTRQRKQAELPEDVQRDRWSGIAATFVFTAESVRQLQGPLPVGPQNAEAEYQRAWQQSIKALTTSDEFFPARKLIQLVCEELQASSIPINSLLSWIQRDIELAKDLVPLKKDNGEMQYSTIENWQLESELLQSFENFRRRPGLSVPTAVVDSTLADRPSLSGEQVDALRKLTAENSAIRILSGVAGAGKSRALDGVRAAFEACGVQVLGGALSGAAKEELRSAAGISCRTVASYLYHLDKAERERQEHAKVREVPGETYVRRLGTPNKVVNLTANTVLIIDEAGMLDSSTLHRLAKHVDRAQATLILVGDDRQIQPIHAGGPFHHLVQKGVTATLQENRRQLNPKDAAAVKDLREGRADKAMENLVNRGRVTVGRNRIDTIHKLVDSWAEHGGARRPTDHLIFTQSRAEARLVNRLCQQERLAQSFRKTTLGITLGNEKLFQGDLVLFHKAYRLAGIENGYRGTILNVDGVRRTITVQLDRKSVDRPMHTPIVTVPIDLLGPEGITPGYAATSHKLQGGSVANAYLLFGSMTDQQMGYVQGTRGKFAIRVFVDRHHADAELQGLIADLKRTRIKKLAHDLVDKRPEQSLQLKIDS